MAAIVNAPNEIVGAAIAIETNYMASRYPDAAKGVPFEKFTDSDSDKYVKAAEEVWKWVQSQLSLAP